MRYLSQRIAGAVGLLFIASIVIFVLLHLAPGNPATAIAGQDATREQVQAIEHALHLDQSLPVQYWHWLTGLLGGHLGESYQLQRPIGPLIASRLGSTAELMVGATVLMVVGGLLLGIAAAESRGPVRRFVEVVSTAFLSAAPFVSAVIFVFVFAISWKVLPAGGQSDFLSDPGLSIQYLAMPSVAVAIPASAVIARLLATEMRRVSQEEFVRTAQAKGAGRRRIVLRHVLPNSVGPALVEVGIRIGELFAGAVVVESLFNRTGIGSLLVNAVEQRDYLLADDCLLLSVAFAVVMQLLTELSMTRIDRRLVLGVGR